MNDDVPSSDADNPQESADLEPIDALRERLPEPLREPGALPLSYSVIERESVTQKKVTHAAVSDRHRTDEYVCQSYSKPITRVIPPDAWEKERNGE